MATTSVGSSGGSTDLGNLNSGSIYNTTGTDNPGTNQGIPDDFNSYVVTALWREGVDVNQIQSMYPGILQALWEDPYIQGLYNSGFGLADTVNPDTGQVTSDPYLTVSNLESAITKELFDPTQTHNQYLISQGMQMLTLSGKQLTAQQSTMANNLGGGDPTILSAIAKAAQATGVPYNVALATAVAESGLDPNAVGDQGCSHGLFQLNTCGGEGQGMTAAQMADPYTNALTALQQFAAVAAQNPSITSNPGAWAAAAQRPQDPTGYASRVNSLLQTGFGATPSGIVPKPFDGSYPISLDYGQPEPGGKGSEEGVDYCLDQNTPILNDNLTWVPIGSLGVGDQLLAFDEEPEIKGTGCKRKWRTAVVLAVGRIVRPTYRITLSDGATITASAEHKWLTRRPSRNRLEWLQTDSLGEGRKYLMRLSSVWRQNPTFSAGYLSGLFDGEGWLSQVPKNSGGYSMAIGAAQKEGKVLEACRVHLSSHSFRWGESTGKESNVVRIRINGGQSEQLRFLGQIRPTRLLSKFDGDKFGVVNGRQVLVERVEYLGDRELVSLRTSTRTLVANGFASHNSMPQGTLLYTPFAGTIEVEDDGKSNWGKRVFVRLDNGDTFAIGHMHSFSVSDGQRVNPGDLLGESGGNPNDPSSGESTGAHIEAQWISPAGQYLNPHAIIDPILSGNATFASLNLSGAEGSGVSSTSAQDRTLGIDPILEQQYPTAVSEFQKYFGRHPTAQELESLIQHGTSQDALESYLREQPSHIQGISIGMYEDVKSNLDSVSNQIFGHGGTDGMVQELVNNGTTTPTGIKFWMMQMDIQGKMDPNTYQQLYQLNQPYQQGIYNDSGFDPRTALNQYNTAQQQGVMFPPPPKTSGTGQPPPPPPAPAPYNPNISGRAGGNVGAQ